MNFPLFIAQRIYSDRSGQRQVSRPAITIATIGVAIGLAVMIVSVGVVLGFKHSIRDKVIGFGSHITVGNFMTLQSSEQYPIQMGDSMMRVLKAIDGVEHVQRYAMKQGILKTDSDFLGIMLKGIGPEYDTTFISHNLKEGCLPHFSDTAASQMVVISKLIADKLRLKNGQRVYAYFIGEQGVRTRRFTIAGIYESNLKHFDETICFTDIYTTNKLNGWEPDQYSGAELTASNFDQLDQVATNVRKKVNHTLDTYGETYSSQDIIKMNPQIFSWLGLMDLNVWMILALMVAVAGVTMISGLLIIILERTQMIGILKALGTRNRQIRHIFLWFAVFIIGRGMLLGNIIGLGLSLLQQHTGLISLDPQTYYVSTVPVETNPLLVVLLNLATLFVCVAVLIGPSFLISHIHPAKSMHYE